MTRIEAARLAREAKQRRAPPLEERFWSKVEKRGADECWPWKAAVRRKDEGYGAFYYGGRHQPASRIAWLLTRGEIAPGLVVCHRCDNPRCVNPGHLFLGTPAENDADRVAKGRQCKGEQQKSARLTEANVRSIRARRSAGETYKSIALGFGVSPATIYDACNRRWRHVR